jgi:hypothetical protein
VRNRVAHDGARVTGALVARAVRVTAVLTVLPVALFVTGAQVASADNGVAEGRFSSGVGMVGLVAVILGVGGLMVGLVRRRRLSATRAAAALLAGEPKPEPDRRVARSSS